MRKTTEVLLFAILTVALALPTFCDDPENPHIVPLYTNSSQELGPVLIGEIRIWNDLTRLHIQFNITNSDWRLTSSHVRILNNAEGLYQKKSFLHSNRYEIDKIHSGVMKFTHKVPINWVAPKDLLITADAEVVPIHGYTSDVTAFAETLPDAIALSVVHPSPDRMAYSLATIAEGDFLDGFHYSWCVDLDRKIEQNTWYTADVYSIFEKLPKYFIEFPENLDLVNWILNADFVGKPSLSGGNYTFGDIQRLIWGLLDNENSPFGLDPWSQKRVDEIYELAKASGEGFIPACNQRLMLILVPVDEIHEIIAQPICIAFPVPCVPAVNKATASVQTVYKSEKKWGSPFVTPVQIR